MAWNACSSVNVRTRRCVILLTDLVLVLLAGQDNFVIYVCTVIALSTSLYSNVRFLQGVSVACYADPCINYTVGLSRVRLSVRPSVRLSVHPSDGGTVSKPHKLRWQNLQRRIAQRLSSLGGKKSSRNSKSFIPSEGVKWELGRKIHNFQPICRRISETGQDRTKVTIIKTNRKSHTPFRLVPKSTTLNGRYVLCCRKDAHHKNLNEDRPILYSAKM